MTENRRIALNVIATYGRSLYALFCGLFTSRWVLMSLGDVDYGLAGLVGGLIGFVTFLNGLMAESIARFYAFAVGEARVAESAVEGRENCRKWFSLAVGIHTGLPIILVLVGYPVGVWAVRHFLTIPLDRVDACIWVWRYSCLSCFISMVSVPFTAMYTAKQEIAEMTIYSIVASSFYLAGIFFMTLFDRDWLPFYAFLTCITSVVPQMVIAVRGVFKFPECRFRFRYLLDKSSWLELTHYSGVRFVCAISQLLTTQGLAIIVNKMFGPARNAAMAIGSNLSSKTMTLTLALRGALQPAITNATGEKNDQRANMLSYMTCVLSTLGVLMFAIPLFIEVDEVMVLWLKKPPAGASILCQVLLVAMFVDQLTIGHVMRIFATGKISRFQLIESIVWTLAIIVAWGWFMSGGDVAGVGIGYLIMYSADNILKLYCANEFGMDWAYWLKKIALPLIVVASVSVLVGVLPSLCMGRSFIRLILTTAVSELVFIPLAWFFAIDKDARNFLKSRVFRRK